MKKYIVVVGVDKEHYFHDLESAAKCFADFVEKNIKVSLLLEEKQILGSFTPFE